MKKIINLFLVFFLFTLSISGLTSKYESEVSISVWQKNI